MERAFLKTLRQWKDHPLRTPLIVRGARQVGKTFAIEAFGRAAFDSACTINLETEAKYRACFDSMDPQAIVSDISKLSQQQIIPGRTLLFLDEIQQCPNALQALRAFKEQLPELHVIAAGSLLEFVLHDEQFSFPVGRVQFARMHPVSFEEFLRACGDIALQEALATFDLATPPTEALHQHLLSRLKEYFLVGGMPAAVTAYLQTRSLLEVQYVRKALWDAFEGDFGKYATRTQYRYLQKLFSTAPRLLGDHVKYSRIDPEAPNPARTLKEALRLLERAGLLYVVSASAGGALPLLASLRETVFKLLLLDIGLAQQALGLDPHYPGMMVGPIAEQYVGQELLAAADPRLDTRLFFWTRPDGVAEVDYLFAHQDTIYPIEVKAGKAGKLKSLQLFLQEKRVPFGIKLSQEALGFAGNVLAVPLYLTAHLPRLIDSARAQRAG